MMMVFLNSIIALLLAATALPSVARAAALTPGWAIQCDGIDDWATLPIPNLPETWTLEAWIKFNSLQTTSIFHMISGDNTVLRLVTSNSGGKGPQIQLDVAGRGVQPSKAFVNNTSTYSHVAVVVGRVPNTAGDGFNNTATMYLDGRQTEFFSVEALYDKRPSAELGLCYTRKLLSAFSVREKFGNIVVDDVRLWAQERTREQIVETMNTIPAGPTLLHWWAMDDGQGSILTDSVQGSHGDLAKRRKYTNQKPMWIPSEAPIEQANFTAIAGVVNTNIPLRLPDGSATEPSSISSADPMNSQVPYTVVSTGETGIFHTNIRQKRLPVAGENKCLHLNGVDAFGISTPFQVPPSFTIDLWIHPSSFVDGYVDFCSKHSKKGSNIFLWEASLKNVQGRLEPVMNVRINSAWYVGGTLLFEPQHLAFVAEADLTRNVTSVVMYRNGEILWKTEMSDILVYDDDGLPWTMGQDYDDRGGIVPSDFFHGVLDEYRFWNRPLTQGEVQHSMNNAIDHGPDYPHLLKKVSFDDGVADDEYSIHGGAKILPCESRFQARPQHEYVEEGHSTNITLRATDPENSALTFALVLAPSEGATSLSDDIVTYDASENGYSTQELRYKVTDQYDFDATFLGRVIIHVLRHGPTVAALEAVASADGYAFGSEVRIVFSEPTNMPAVEASDGVVQFSPPIAKQLELNWESDTVLLAVVAEPLESAEGLLEHATVHVRGKIRAKDELSAEVDSVSPVLQGDWQAPGSLTSWSIATIVIIPFTVLMLATAIFVARSKIRRLKNAPKDRSSPMSILFTDIEGSTKLWSRNAAAMSKAIDIHHKVIRKAIQTHSCYEVKTIGDSFMVACKRPVDAVKLALAVQTRLSEAFETDFGKKFGCLNAFGGDHEKDWSDIELKIRIGIHHGIADITFDEVASGYDYYGHTVNVASRVESAGHGDQILITEAVHNAVKDDMRGLSAVVKDLGENPLRGVGDVALFELLPVKFAGKTFPPLRLDKVTEILEKEHAPERATDEIGREASVTSLDLDTNWVASRVYRNVLVQSGAVEAEDLLGFVQSIVVALRLLFSVGGESGKHMVKVLAEKWKVPYGLHESSLRQLAFKIAVTTRERMEDDGLLVPNSGGGGGGSRPKESAQPLVDRATQQ